MRSLDPLDVVAPCAERWEGMRRVDADERHCVACARSVIDLDELSLTEGAPKLAALRDRGAITACVRLRTVRAARGAVALAVLGACGGPRATPAAPATSASATASTAPSSSPSPAPPPSGPPSAASAPLAQDASALRIVLTHTLGIVILQQVRFARGSSTLVPESEPVLDEIARAMRGNPSLTRVAVEGHASTDERDVMALTERRARAVVDRLVAAGVARDRLVARGRGAGQPIDTNATADARARNRRVEVRVEGESSEATAPPDGGVACAAPAESGR